MKKYKSFKEVDRDLEVLKLQNELDKEEVKLSIQHTKEGLAPGYLLNSAATAAVKKAILIKTTVKLAGKRMITSLVSSL